ncbi:MAG: hypothetical protein ACKOA2_09225 [Ilumatobacteraceae bacterium]
MQRLVGLTVAAVCSIGAGAIHASAAGAHAEHIGLARLFVVVAVAQLAAGVAALTRPSRVVAGIVAAVNAAAVGGWLVTRTAGVSFIDGLSAREAPGVPDTVCAALGAIAVGGALAAVLIGARTAVTGRVAAPAVLVAALAVPAMWTGASDVHDHGSGEVAAADDHADEHGDDHDAAHADEAAPSWPRPWDPTAPIDFSGVDGVSAAQQQRAEELAAATLEQLPRWSDPATAIADGYVSIGDASTGSEHFLNAALIGDEHFLDPRYPESLVYTVEGDRRVLAGAMFIASARPTDDPTLLDFAGPLMTWHNHGDLCWGLIDGRPAVVGTTGPTGTCTNGVNAGTEFPMVHVWVVPHQCGVFAALEGVGMGQAAVPESERVDLCHDEHGHGHDDGGSTGRPYDPTQPIDLGGFPGVTPEQQAAAENLVAVTLVRLPKWADYRVAEAAGFRSIGDGLTGHEHFINWAWIDDDVWLDPDRPESLVYEPQPDGSRRLVSAMFMLPRSVGLDEVPDIGGALMQWHIHDDLCFTDDPEAPRVASVTEVGGPCPAGLVKFPPVAMIHVWIVPHPCGPFAALEGVGAGQVLTGEDKLCDHLHGSG